MRTVSHPGIDKLSYIHDYSVDGATKSVGSGRDALPRMRLHGAAEVTGQAGHGEAPASTAVDLSIIVTAHNEGTEVARTIESIRGSTTSPYEIILVDEGSTDGSTIGIESDDVHVIRHDKRIGVARSRHEASQYATGSAVCYLDAHQRLSPGCLDQCAELALDKEAIVSPDIRGFSSFSLKMRGAHFTLTDREGFFGGRWKLVRPAQNPSRSTTLRAPGYVIPAALYSRVAWSETLRGWGGSEAAIALKAFFTGIDILTLHGPVARHKFRRKFPYRTTWDEVWRNQAILARICFDKATWFDYWLPEVFEGNLSDDALSDLESEQLLAEHEKFQAIKIYADREFWEVLLHQPEPVNL